MAAKEVKLEKGIRKGKLNLGIRAKLLGLLLSIVALIMVGILALVYMNTSDIMQRSNKELLETSTQSVANKVEAWMNQIISVLDTERDTLEYFSMNEQDERDYIKHTAGKYDAFPTGIYVADTKGHLIHSSFIPDENYSVFDREWYKEGLQSESFVFGSAYLDEDSKNYVVGAFGAIKDKKGKVKGVASADIYLDAISSIVKEVHLKETGGVFLIDEKTNMIIGHEDETLVGTVLTDQKDSMYSFLSGLIAEKKYGIQIYDDPSSGPIYLNAMKVADSNWIVASYVPQNEVMKDLNTLTRNVIVLAVAAIFILFIAIIILVNKAIVKPVKEINKVACQIADGYLDEKITYRSNDEFGELADNFNQTVIRLKDYIGYIDETSRVLDEISKGNLDFSLDLDYTGEFAKIKDAFGKISISLNEVMRNIYQASNEVANDSTQIANGAQALSQGTTEQASAIEQLAATITDISGQVKKSADHAKKAKSESEHTLLEINESNKQMQEMIEAMDKISSKSGEIGAIVKTIEDIAFQTNILALNAAVEAARAGNAGKGFAVVADEVRNLAGKSAEAARDTTGLIEETVKAVDDGVIIADGTGQSLAKVVEKMKQTTGLIEEISDTSQLQAQQIEQVTVGIEQISTVVQNNSATAQESAAASEEITGQVMTLHELVARFKLKD